jgi:epoxyqueuosine reductase
MEAVVSSAWVIEHGRALGFDKVGVAPASDLPELGFLPTWLERGYAGTLPYMNDPRRGDVRALLPDSRSVICCALIYDTDYPHSTELPLDPERGWVSRYAWGDDYHLVVHQKLEALRAAIAEKVGEGFSAKLYVDTGPVLERVYGHHAGLGWMAKNTCLLDGELGSFFFVGVLVTNLALAPDRPPADGCGSCSLCLEACPTGALDPGRPYILDARRCISYLTIELRGPIPAELRQPMGRHVFGCDICQDVCPYNRRSRLTEEAAFQPRRIRTQPAPGKPKFETRLSPAACPDPAPVGQRDSAAGDLLVTDHRTPNTGHQSLFHPSLEWLASLSEEEFRQIFKNSAVRRAKWRGLMRNVLVAMGNSGDSRFCPLLRRFAASDDPLLAEHARWALDQLGETTDEHG